MTIGLLVGAAIVAAGFLFGGRSASRHTPFESHNAQLSPIATPDRWQPARHSQPAIDPFLHMVSAQFPIVWFRYVNAEDEESERQVAIYGGSLDEKTGDVVHFYGLCSVARRERTFRADRVIEMRDLTTGRIVSDASRHLRRYMHPTE